MRKGTIILLAIFMALTFLGLLAVQLNYFSTLIEIRQQHFWQARRAQPNPGDRARARDWLAVSGSAITTKARR